MLHYDELPTFEGETEQTTLRKWMVELCAECHCRHDMVITLTILTEFKIIKQICESMKGLVDHSTLTGSPRHHA